MKAATTSVRGRVVRAEDGAPLAGVAVRVCREPHGNTRDVLVATETGTDGSFSLDRVPEAPSNGLPLFLEFTQSGRVRRVLGFQWDRGDPTPRRVIVPMSAGGRLHGRVTVRGRASPRRGVRVGVRARGRWDGTTPHPALPWHMHGKPVRFFSVDAPVHVACAADGTFEVDGLPLDVDLEVGAAVGDGGPLVPRALARVPSGDRSTGIDLAVHRAHRVVVHVHDEQGRPIDGAAVEGETTARTGPGGTARVAPDARSGVPHVSVARPGFGRVRVDVADDPPANEPVVVRLHPTVALRGRVTDSAGRAVPRTKVTLWPLEVDGDALPCHVRTDARGEFRHDDLAPGVWQVSAKPRGSTLSVTEVRIPASDVELRVLRAASISFDVDAARGACQPGVIDILLPAGLEWVPDATRVAVFYEPRLRRARQRRVVLRGVPPGRYPLELWARGFEPLEVALNVHESEDVDLETLTLEPSGRGDEAAPEWSLTRLRQEGAGR